jgi:hypothetical protein
MVDNPVRVRDLRTIIIVVNYLVKVQELKTISAAWCTTWFESRL